MTNFTSNLFKLCALTMLTMPYGCSSEELSGEGASITGKKKNVEKKAVLKDEESDLEAEADQKNKVTKGIDNSGAAFQVKDVALLRSSISSCMGAEKLLVTADMLIPFGQAGDSLNDNSDGRYRFLLGKENADDPNGYAIGDDIIEKERSSLVDFSLGNRTGISSDSLTDTYLRSLETIANVVAHYCDANVEVCKCGTKDDAKVVLQRCLPGIDPNSEKIDYASLLIFEECKDGNAGVRRAIASLLSSYAFASAR
jgi:hypothetical protein